MKDKSALLKAAGSVGSFTVASRISGYLRDVSLATVLGAGFSMDAFTIAFRLANLFRRFFAEGVMSAAFIPIFSEYRENHSSNDLWAFARKFYSALGLTLAAMVLIEIIFSPWIVSLMAPGFSWNSEKWELAVFLNRLMAPFLLFMGLAAVLMGILNSRRIFGVSAAAPILFNLSMIAAAFGLTPFFHEPAVGVSLGVLFGGCAQWLIQIPAARKLGMNLKPTLSLAHVGVKRIFKKMGPGIFGMGIVQINLLIDSLMASLLMEGAVSSIYYANRVMELVLGIFVISLATVILPEMSKHAARKDHEEMKSTLSFSLRMVAFVAVPATVGLFILSKPVTRVLFEHGRFDAVDTQRTAFALMFYSVGILFIGTARILASGFYAMGDTKTPVRTAAWSLLANIALNVILMIPLKQGGLALATSLAAALNSYQLLIRFQKKFGPLDWSVLHHSLFKILTGSAALGTACFVFSYVFQTQHPAIRLFLTIGLSLAVYLGTCFALKSPELHSLSRILRRGAE